MALEFQEKLAVYTTAKESAEAARRVAPEDTLPVQFGGTCKRMPEHIAQHTGWANTDPKWRATLFTGTKLGGYYV